MRFDRKKDKKFAAVLVICFIVISGCVLGRKLISDAGNMEIKIGGLTVVVPDNMLCADVKSFLNVRINPSVDSAVIAKLYPGDAVEYIGEKGSWTMVNLDGQTGYVSTQYTVRGMDLKKYIKKHMNKFTIEGTVVESSFTPVYKKEEQVGSEKPAYTMKGEVNKKTTVYATKSTKSKVANETENVEKYMVMVNGLRFREKSSTDAKIFCNFNKGTYVEAVSDKNAGWMKVKYNGKIGFVAKKYVKMVTVKQKKSNLLGSLQKNEQVVVNNLWKNWAEISYHNKLSYIKREAVEVTAKLDNSNKNIIKLVANNTQCDVLDVHKNVAFVKFADNKKGYLDARCVQAKIDFSNIKLDESAIKTANQKVVKTNLGKASKIRKELVKFALQYVGNKYVWGGNSLTEGVDCSGFTQQVYLHFGIQINRCSYEQVRNGKEITFDQLQPGDLIFYYNKELKRIGHVALYIGDGQIVHAKSSKTGIVINNWDYQTPYKAVTILENK
ncbi:MAG: SH3 domain-containing protein [Lachnospiraceae bacterium]|nr:SH3 domain-containing protein [Lachnospiraceae bacterium]